MTDATRTLEIILGPTGVGKTEYSIRKALEYGCPVVSCDSRQIFKEMRIGTAAPSDEELAAVPHYFIRSVSVAENYNAGRYEEEALALLDRLFAEGHPRIVMSGGSMMYIDAVCNGLDSFPDIPLTLREHLMDCLKSEGVESLAEQLKELDPVAYSEMDLSNGQRVVRALEVCLFTGEPYSSFKTGTVKKRDFRIVKTGLTRPREELYRRIDRRVLRMMDKGLEREAWGLRPYREMTSLQTVGYREMFEFFDGTTSLEKAVSLIQRNTRHYAKRQLTWWRRDTDIQWVELG